MAIDRETIISILKHRGPSLPVHIKKALGTGDTFIVGAMLSELKSAGRIRVSNTKRGGSPFYYLPEHAPRLVELIKELPEKERRTAELLREKKILRDNEQDPLVRVTLRAIKDFAIPIEVKLKTGTELFWKWFLTTNQEAEQIIKKQLGLLEGEKKKPLKEEAIKEKTESLTQKNTKESRPETKKPEKTTDHKKTLKSLKEFDDSEDSSDPFLKKLMQYFKENKIEVLSKKIIRKNSDIEFELRIPSAVGMIDYYCKAKSKKKCNDGDLSSAYLQGQNKRLPVLFLTTGKVTKKAKEALKTSFKGMVLKEI